MHNLPKRGRPSTASRDANLTAIAESAVRSPKKSIRERSAEFELANGSVGRNVTSRHVSH